MMFSIFMILKEEFLYAKMCLHKTFLKYKYILNLLYLDVLYFKISKNVFLYD